ncbi:CCAAT/enhancer-binding protein zeta [Contarinia nasturtii]|uniref:CCAAT/enhancer-binding protein zeta n=1 Tax=Contarinia nasturtii TaxID=265458 RepID=UPI0012D389B6|nr:CCAAT/enhancer-binding protein zeta [Contarinia nasturtii]
MALKTKSVNPKKVNFNSDNSSSDIAGKSKHIIFDEEDNETDVIVEPKQVLAEKKHQGSKKSEKNRKNALEIGKLWYQTFAEYNTSDELVEMKNNEIEELTNYCGKCYEEQKTAFAKRNPSDVKWLQTALHKGTSKDRANAGGLLVQSNPLANLETLESLISFTKLTNKNSTDSIDVATDLFINALLPPDRKLLSFTLRGADWKALKKNDNVDKMTKDQIYAYWHFETIIKDQYFEFLRNIQNAIQSGQEANKKQAIICASKLLSYAPEKEQMLLSMLVNKLGDPSKMIASKALHHLTEVSFKHPAMCGVIANETEKFLFRNNITEHAQHFALCFLSQLAPHGNVEVCTKLVNVSLSFFKVVVNKGLINSKIMQAILLCLKHSITDVVEANKSKPGSDSGLISKDTQDTIYRLVHFANIKVSLQTLALILQMITAMGAEHQHNRFYNALYKKLLDPELATCGSKYSALFLHIVHRAIHVDRNKSRAQAFIKRLLQVALFLPAPITCGCLIIISKIIKARSELNRIEIPLAVAPKIEDDVGNVESDEHGDTTEHETKIKPNGYDPYHRAPEFAGGEYSIRTELAALLHYYHPTVRVFAQNILEDKPIKFYGDPLVDFSLTHFLDRFAFKNPKKDAENKPVSIVHAFHHKNYTPHGSRGKPVKQLSSASCTEDEKFIFEFLDKKRARQAALGLDQKDRFESVDDDEFDAYLDGLGGKKGKDGLDDEEFDILGDFGEAKGTTEDDGEDWDSDGDDDDDDEDGEGNAKADMDDGDEFDGSDAGSISLDEDDDDDEDGSDIFESDEEGEEELDSDAEVSDPEDEPKAKRPRSVSSKDFQKKLKNTSNMNSLFAAAEDFSEMLEDTGKSSKHGTLGEIFNQDKSSEKQIEWESKRLKNSRANFRRKPTQKRNRSQGKNRRGETNKNKKNQIGGKRKHK